MMGFNHSMVVTARLRPDVTVDQLVAAFNPVFDYTGYDGNKAFTTGETLMGEDRFTFDAETGDLDVATYGDVGYGYCTDVVTPLARNLDPLVAEAGEIWLTDLDTEDIDGAKTVVEFGPSKPAIKRYVANRDIQQALSLLRPHITIPTYTVIHALLKGELDPLTVEQSNFMQKIEASLWSAMLHQDYSSLPLLLDDVKMLNARQG